MDTVTALICLRFSSLCNSRQFDIAKHTNIDDLVLRLGVSAADLREVWKCKSYMYVCSICKGCKNIY